MNGLDNYLNTLGQQRNDQLAGSLRDALQVNPDDYAKTVRLAKAAGVEVEAVPLYADVAQEAQYLDGIGFRTLWKDSPKTAEFLSDSGNARLAHDDVANLSGFETALHYLGNGGRALASSVPSANQGLWGMAQAGAEVLSKYVTGPLAGTILPEDIGANMASAFSRKRKTAEAIANGLMPQANGNVEAGVYSGLQSLGQNLLMLPAAVMTGQPGMALAPMVATVGGQAYGQARDKGIGVEPSLTFGASQSLVEYATEKLPMAWLLKDLKAGAPFWKTLGRQAMSEVPGEQVATLLQDMNEWAVINPEKSAWDYMRERPDAAAQTLIATLVGVGGQVSVLKGVDATVQRLNGQARRGEQDGQLLGQIDQLASASKVRGRDTETFGAFIARATGSGPVQDVYIAADVLNQSGVAEQLAAASPSVAEQLPVALATGGNVRIPVAEYATHIAGTEYSQSLLDHLKTDPDGFSRAEAQQFMQSHGEVLQREVEQALAASHEHDVFKAGQDAVKQTVLDELNALGRFSPEKNELDATLIAARSAVRAAQLGMTPEAFFEKQRLRVAAEDVLGGQHFQQDAQEGPFGPVLTEHRGDAQGAITKLMELQTGEAIGALHHPELGEIDLVWGEQGDPENKFEGGYGLAKIIAKHPEVVSNLAEIVAKLPVVKQGPNRARLASEDHTAVIRLTWDGQTKHWLLTAFENEKEPTDSNTRTGVVGQDDETRSSTSGSDDIVDQTIKQFYQAQSSVRGSFSPSSNTIALLKNADLSTFLHEGGHYFFENDIALATELTGKQRAGENLSTGEQQIVDDVHALLAWHGIRGDIGVQLEQWGMMAFEEKRARHERTAEAFEAYLFEGKAPSIELQQMFRTFRAWLMNVYRSLKGFVDSHPESGQLNDEVRGVFDRMLASTEEIQLAEQGRSMMPLFASAEQAGMTAEEFAAYQSLGVNATQSAIEDLQARGLRDMQWLHNARGRTIKRLQKEAKALRAEVRRQIADEVDARPVYRADRFLRYGEVRTDGGEDIKVKAGHRLSIPVLRDMFPKAELASVSWESLGYGQYGALSEDGLHPDLVAEMFGFTSGDELVRSLVAAPRRNEEIEALTDVRMLEQFGDLASQEAIEKAADKAIHNDARARFVATEANALAKATGQRKIFAGAAREYAAALVARTAVRDLRPAQYASAETRAAKNAAIAMKAGDLATAAAEKRNQLIQSYAAKASHEARAEADTIIGSWSKLANRPDSKLGKSYDLDLINAVRAILGEYGVAERRAKRASEYLNAVQSYDPEMYGVIRTSVVAAEANAKPVRELTVEELRGLRDEIDAILHLAKRSRQMEVDGNLLDRQDVENELHARLEEIGIPRIIPGEGQAVTPGEARMAKFKALIAFARRMESWVGQMDGSQSIGPFRRFVWNRIKDSADAYRADKARYLKKFRALVNGIAPTLKPMTLKATELDYTFGKDSGGSAINEILHAILHTGNASNKRKLLLGRGWAIELPDGTIDTSRWDAFIARMVKEGRLTKAHFDFVQGVWDLMDSIKPLAQKTHRDVFGRYFDEITADPVQTPFGEYRGGYVPAMADTRVVKDAELRKLADDDNAAMAYAYPTTPKGFTKNRVEYNRPLLLDLRTLAQHIDKVLLFSHMEMPVRDVQRVLSGKVGQAISRIDSAAMASMIVPWLSRSAKQQVEAPVTGSAGTLRFFSVMRSRAGMAAMFGNLSNTVQQITGFSLAAVKVKPVLLLRATADYMKAPREMSRAVAEASVFMAGRMENEVATMNDAINDVLLNPSLLERGQAWTMRHAYFMQSAFDNVMSPIIWTAAYNQAVAEGISHADAVRLGDSAVRETQGSTMPEDVSRIETGNAFVRLFTQFAGYFNMQANLLGTEYAKLMADAGLRKGAGRGLYLFLFGFLVPAVAAEAIVQLFRGGAEDDDKDGEYLDDWLAALLFYAPLRNATAMVPVAGPIINAGVNVWNGKPYDDRISTSPAISMLESAVQAPKSIYRATVDDGGSQKAVRDVATLMSMTLGLPANLVARPVGYAAGVANEKTEPTGPVDALRGAFTGVASPDSKR